MKGLRSIATKCFKSWEISKERKAEGVRGHGLDMSAQSAVVNAGSCVYRVYKVYCYGMWSRLSSSNAVVLDLLRTSRKEGFSRYRVRLSG